MPDLSSIVRDFASGIERVDSTKPLAVNVRTKKPYQPGIGPHTEAQTVRLVMDELSRRQPKIYGTYRTSVPYPELSRQRCDLCIGDGPEWAIEIKMLRFLGDNGKPNDNILTHILSPYPANRSALTDTEKLTATSLGRRKAILIYGYDYEDWPMDPAIEAFELLAGRKVLLGPRESAKFLDLVHPVHANGRVFRWEIGASPVQRLA